MRLLAFTTFILFAIVAAAPVTSHAADENAALYNRAGELYGEERYGEALALYEQLIDRGIRNADLYYNASNAAYRTGNLGKAILYIERSLRLDPSDRDARENRAFLRSRKIDGAPPNTNAVAAYFSRWYEGLRPGRLAWWSALTFAAGAVCAMILMFTGGMKRMGAWGATAVLLALFLSSTGILVEKAVRDDSHAEAVILADEVRAYSGPGETNTHVFTIHEGTKVVLEQTRSGWHLVRLDSGAGGWIRADAMEEI